MIELRLRLPFVWLLVCLVAAFLLPDRIWNTLLIGLGGLFVVAYVWVRQLAEGLTAVRQLRFGWVAVGDMLEEQFTLSNRSAVPALWVEVVDQANVPGYRPAIVQSVGERKQTQWRETAVCRQRGQYQLGPWRIRSSDPFGIFTVTRFYPVAGEIVIHPPIHTDIPVPLPAGKNSGRTRATRRAWQATINAAAVRAYQPQDPFRWIHWPTSARKSELFVRTFDLDAAGAIWVCLDLREQVQLGEGINSTEEHMVLLAASLTVQALQQNRPIGLATYGQTPQLVPPGLGAEQRWRLLRSLALVRADGTTSLSKALADLQRLTRPGTAVLLMTPDANPTWAPQIASLQQAGIQTQVTLLDRPSFGGRTNSAAARDLLTSMETAVHLVHQGELGQAPEPIDPKGHWDFIVTGTGKVVQRGSR